MMNMMLMGNHSSLISSSSSLPILSPHWPNNKNSRRKTLIHQLEISSQIARPISMPAAAASFQYHHPPTTRIRSSVNMWNCNNQEEKGDNNNLEFIRGDKLLSDVCSWGIGGPAKYFLPVFDLTQLASAIRYCQEHSLRFMILGKGSNCLFDELGFDGCVIQNRIEFFERIESGVYRVGSGFPFNRLGVKCSTEGFTGLEFAAGIPGTVGGAVYMNAGANGQETADAVESIEIITTEGEVITMKRKDLVFGYRSSPFQDMKNLAAITAVTFRLRHSEYARMWQQLYLERRKLSQPLTEYTAGSVFRNPPSEMGVSAAELIEKAGLKGHSVGSAMVSTLHANFLVNDGGATSQEMLLLIEFVKSVVRLKFGVQLKEEILYIPFSSP